jgi:threonine/homoserine efflux transporter RhtA
VTGRRSQASRGDAVLAHVVTLAVTGAVLLALHGSGHSPLLVVGVSLAVYVAALVAMLAIARGRARRRSALERVNFDAYIAERDRRLDG